MVCIEVKTSLFFKQDYNFHFPAFSISPVQHSLKSCLAYKRQKNLADLLIRAKIHPEEITHTKRTQNGMKRCKQNCLICPYIKKGKVVRGKDFDWHIMGDINCKSSNIVYMIECNIERCQQRYVGETHKKLYDRFSEHLGYVRTKQLSQTTGAHFNS